LRGAVGCVAVGKGKWEGKKGKEREENGMIAGRGKLENGEGREARPHPNKILILHCTY